MKNLLTALLLLFAMTASAKITLPSVVGNDMVLQQQSEARIWGKATANVDVVVTTSWQEGSVHAKADKNGNWEVKVQTPAASFAEQTLTIVDMKDMQGVTLTGILIGEVWLASGQSNMEMPLRGFDGCAVKNGVSDAMHAMKNSPYVRMFTVKKRDDALTPQEDCEGAWQKPLAKNALWFSATAYYFANALSDALQVPVGIVNASYGGTRIEGWMSKEILKNDPKVNLDEKAIMARGAWDRPTVNYYGMFYPVKNYTYKGIIWYQGCSNVGDHAPYAQQMADMVSLWRNDLQQGEIPFYYVELAPYHYFGGQANKAAYLREAQFKAQDMIPNSGMVCTNDLVEPFELMNIHPGNKRAVGERLTTLALNKTYGYTDITCEGPRFKAYEIKDGAVAVSFDHLQQGICRNYDIHGFEVAGEDRVFYPAEANFVWQTNQVFLKSEKVPNPVAARYCFKDWQVGAFYGGDFQPLVPFRTDDWE